MKTYKTIYQLQVANDEIKKSKFIATAMPVPNKAAAEEWIKEIQRQYKDATHNVFAYRVVENGVLLERQSDDGEPSGTAGMPILEVLRGEELTSVAVVVTRYYGGTLLGTGGLTQAYGRTAKLSLYDIIEKSPYKRYVVTTDYSQMGQVQYEVLQDGHILHDTVYTDAVEFIIYVAEQNAGAFVKKIANVTSGTAQVVEDAVVYGFYYGGEFMTSDE